ncbi:hypothetical protein HDU83_006148 [Entophlyctis luteolus]|nr:hypothetical protein HDU83_006148 [Entophlyctis luteolus]
MSSPVAPAASRTARPTPPLSLPSRPIPLAAASSASPLYPHMERMSLLPAPSSAPDFVLDESAADSVPTPTPASANLAFGLRPVTAPSSSSASSSSKPGSLNPATLLFHPATAAKPSQLKFPSPNVPMSVTHSKNSEDAAVAGNSSSDGNRPNVDHDEIPEESEPVQMDEDTDEIVNALDRSLVGKKGTADEKKFACTEAECTATFAQLAHLKIHMRRHTGERPFACAYCDKTFNQKGNLKTHERKHTGDKPFKCTHPGCTKEFSQQGNLRTHEKIHLNVKRFTCEQCGKSFSQFGNLKSHIQKVHERPQVRRPRANSTTSIAKRDTSKASKVGGSAAARPRISSVSSVGSSSTSAAITGPRFIPTTAVAAARLSTSAAGASSGFVGSIQLDRNFGLTSSSRSALGAGAFRDRLSTSLMTPPSSDWSTFDRDGDWVMNGFVAFSEGELFDSDEDDSEIDESDVDEESNDDEEHDFANPEIWVTGPFSDALARGPTADFDDSLAADASRLLLDLKNSEGDQLERRAPDSSYRVDALKSHDAADGKVIGINANATEIGAKSALNGASGISSLSLGFASSDRAKEPQACSTPKYSMSLNAVEGSGTAFAASALSSSLRTVGGNSGVVKKQRKGRASKQLSSVLPPASQMNKLRGRSVSLSREQLQQRNQQMQPHAHFDDGLQFIIDGFEHVENLERHQQQEKIDEQHRETKSVGLDEEEAARVLASVSFDSRDGFGGFGGAGLSMSMPANGAAPRGSHKLVNAWETPVESEDGLLPLLATAAASWGVPEVRRSLHNNGGDGPQLRRGSSIGAGALGGFGSVGAGTRRSSTAASISGTPTSGTAKMFERNVMTQFVDAVAKRRDQKQLLQPPSQQQYALRQRYLL